MNISVIAPRQLFDTVQSGTSVDLLDVRTPVEYAEVHIPFARNVPLDELDPGGVMANHTDAAAPLYITCRSGGRGRKACEKMHAAGFTNVVNVEGGTQAWELAGLPVVRGSKVVSLERQVRIAAGVLVMIGAGLGAFVNPAWIGLSAFVGAGLVFAGVTDTCGMGLMLARMPWNRVPAATLAPATDKACTSGQKNSCCG